MIKDISNQEKNRIRSILDKNEFNQTQVKKTKDYDIFTLRSDNRERIDQAHVRRLIQSIKAKNLLELRPISVNGDMEVIDGQHRLMAAKALGVDIYYQVNERLKSEDIIVMNIAKSWTFNDYLNYYVKNGYAEYIALNNFMREHNLPLKTCLNIQIGKVKESYLDFKAGKFKFTEEDMNERLSICWETIDIIRRNNATCSFVKATKFWKALLKLVNHDKFEKEPFFANLKKQVDTVGTRINDKEYFKMFVKIYNYRRAEKIVVEEE